MYIILWYTLPEDTIMREMITYANFAFSRPNILNIIMFNNAQFNEREMKHF